METTLALEAIHIDAVSAVGALLRRARLGSPLAPAALTRSGLAAVPLVVQGDAAADLLAEAIAAGTATVSEVSDAGTVSRLLVRHAGSRPLLLLHGEEVL